MPGIDANQVKAVLLKIKAQKQAGKGRNNAEAFRQGIANKREATRLLSSIVTPFTPAQVTLDTPFLIWTLRDPDAPIILVDSQIVPGGSWAKVLLSTASDDTLLGYDQVDFYFFWENSTGQPAVVNVESFLMFDGSGNAYGHGRWLPVWFPIDTTFGNADLEIAAHLELLEWWNQPPTTPLNESGQLQSVASVYNEGRWNLLGPSVGITKSVSGNSHVYYDTFFVPTNGVVVFMVGLGFSIFGVDGEASVDFATDPFIIICPHLQLEIMTTSQSILTS
jgi:hypothetical protein